MRDRVLARFEHAGAAGADLRLLDTCLHAALAARERAVPEADPRLLHPARTVLILIDDADCSDVVQLAAGALLDSAEPRWRGEALPDLPSASAELRAAIELCAAVPTPDAVPEDRLLEELVVASPGARLLACAERLDLARHIHLTEPRALREWVLQAQLVYTPVAWRTEPRLARRFTRWADAYARKLDGG